jgi:pantothenate kinase
VPTPFESLTGRVDELLARGGRILGIAGPPGSGKSTLCDRLLAHYGERAQVLPMDGFHLANEELARLGRAGRKGAPDTFDVDGYIATLERVRARATDVLAPRFHREIEEAVAGSIRIRPETQLVITDGNYLLLQLGRWADVAALLDDRWVLAPDDAARCARLVARHEGHGRHPHEAAAWVRDVDEPNAALVAAASRAPDFVVDPG